MRQQLRQTIHHFLICTVVTKWSYLKIVKHFELRVQANVFFSNKKERVSQKKYKEEIEEERYKDKT